MQKNNALLVILVLLPSTMALCIKNSKDVKPNTPKDENEINKMNEKWDYYQQKLDLSQKKVEFLKSQKDQEATIKMLDTFIKENPQYTKPSANQEKSADPFQEFYNALVKELQKSKQTLKTSLNFELADKTPKELNRPRRKISVKMVTDMPSDKIDDLLKAFNEEHGIESSENDDEDYDDMVYEDVGVPHGQPLSAAAYQGHDYDVVDDGEDPEMTWNSSHNYRSNSFQELINMATRKRMQQEEEENKLIRKNPYFF